MNDLPEELRNKISALKERVEVDPAAVQRLKSGLRSEPGPTGGIWGWLSGPRSFSASPLQLITSAGIAVAATILITLSLSEPSRLAVEPIEAAIAADAQIIRFVYVDPSADSVVVTGDFNNWDLTSTRLERVAPEGVWMALIPLESGRYTYSFVVNGTMWRPDPAAPPAPADDFGRPSSVLLVSSVQ